MQKWFAILLFLVLSVRPAYYLGQVTYYQLNIDYIIKTYCINTDKPELQCHGKCHLAKQMQLDNNESSSDENLNTLAILECFYSIFNNPQDYYFTYNAEVLSHNKNAIAKYINTYSYLGDMSLLKPPIH